MSGRGGYTRIAKSGRPIGMIRKNPHATSAVGQILAWFAYSFIGLMAMTALALAIHNIIVGTQRHNDRNKYTKSVGFSAFKNTTQAITNEVVTDVNEWEVCGGYPSYDNTKGQFNATSGVFTIKKEAYYVAAATACFNASGSGVREVHLVTSGAEIMTAVTRVSGDATSAGDQCVSVSQILWLVEDAEVYIEVYTDSGIEEAVVAGSLFSVERIAK